MPIFRIERAPDALLVVEDLPGEVAQFGDYEGCAVFDHGDAETVKLVLKVCRIHPKRQISPEQIEKMRKRFSKAPQGSDISG